MATIPVTSGLQLLLDARTITGLSDGDGIAAWNDSSANGNNAAQANAANRLVYKTNIYGSNPAARCDATNKQIGGSYSSWTGGTGATILCCVSNTPTGQGASLRTFVTAATGANDTSHYLIGLGNGLEIWVNAASRISLSNVNSTQPQIVGFAVDSSQIDLLINGIFRGNVAHVFSLPSSTQNVYATGRIASGAMSGDFCKSTDFHFITAFSRRLTFTEINDVCCWMLAELGMATAGGTSRPVNPFQQQVIA